MRPRLRRPPPRVFEAGATAGARPSPGCSRPGPAGLSNEVLLVTTASRGMALTATRSFVLSVPPDLGDKPLPRALVFGWHALGATGEMVRAQGVEQFAQLHAIFVYPDAARLQDGRVGWNPSLETGDIVFFDALYAHLREHYCIDEARVFSFGFSFGGYMTNLLGCHRGGSVLKGIAVLSGGGPFGTCTSSVAAWITHARDDAVIPFPEGERSRDHWVRANGCDPSGAKPMNELGQGCLSYQSCEPGRPVIWCPRPFGGHGWVGYAPMAIWNFFQNL